MSHGIYQYPAMMVPSLQREIVGFISDRLGSGLTIFDPFVGSGTTMSEAMMLGHNFVGVDINPLALLICMAKANVVSPARLDDSFCDVVNRAHSDKSTRLEASFPARDYWYEKGTSVALSRLRRAVRRQRWPEKLVSWVTLAEVARIVSNTRSSTFKLHRRTSADISSRRDLRPIDIFQTLASRNTAALAEQWRFLNLSGSLDKHHTYKSTIDLVLGDTRASPWRENLRADALLTSPPYGDNKSTVTYGQAAYLPLQWVDREDFDIIEESLRTTKRIDSLSLGGSLKISSECLREVRLRSPSLSSTLDSLIDRPRDRAQRVAAFCIDFSQALAASLTALKDDAPIIMTVGNRTVGGIEIPTADIAVELLESYGAIHIDTIARQIPVYRKRHPLRNSLSRTIESEVMLVLRAPSSATHSTIGRRKRRSS
jgi:hypothetical protein